MLLLLLCSAAVMIVMVVVMMVVMVVVFQTSLFDKQTNTRFRLTGLDWTGRMQQCSYTK